MAHHEDKHREKPDHRQIEVEAIAGVWLLHWYLAEHVIELILWNTIAVALGIIHQVVSATVFLAEIEPPNSCTRWEPKMV